MKGRRQLVGRAVTVVLACLALAMAGGAPSDHHVNVIGEHLMQVLETAR
jgi:hypothetical protein